VFKLTRQIYGVNYQIVLCHCAWCFKVGGAGAALSTYSFGRAEEFHSTDYFCLQLPQYFKKDKDTQIMFLRSSQSQEFPNIL
jgi:hypothetical protein